MYPVLVRSVILPAADGVLGLSIHKHLSELKQSQWQGVKELKELQRTKLVKALLHARANIPYFRDALHAVSESRIEAEPHAVCAELNYLTKEIIRENFPARITAEDIPLSKCKMTRTAGSTGAPLDYVVSRNGYSAYWAHHLRAFETAGYYFGDKIVYLAAVRHLSTVRRIRDFLIRQIQLDAYQTSERLFELYLEKIRRYQPRILRGYPEILFLLADLAERKRVEDIRPRSIISNSNKLFDFQRKYIEKVFQAPVFDYYSCPESGAFAFECEKHEGYHLALEHGLVEITDANWKPVDTGTGAIVSTNFDNMAMGFIKYITGDIATTTGRICSCGRGLPLIDSVEGRTHSLVVTKDGRYLHGVLLEQPFLHEERFKDFAQWVDRVQLVQENEELLVIKIVRKAGLDQKGLDAVVNEVKRLLGPGMSVEIEFVESIEKPLSGKRQLIVSKVLPERMKDRLAKLET